MMPNIYGLIDPRTNEIRYVGKTKNPISKRLLDHIKYAKGGQKNHRSNWIRQLLKCELRPTIRVLEETTEDNWQVIEQKWITRLSNLTNQTKGGDGFTGTHSKEVRQKISEAGKGRKHSEEMKKKASIRMKGYQINKPGIPLSESHRKKIGEANRGSKNGMYGKSSWMKGRKHTEENKRKASTRMKGNQINKPGIPLTEKHKESLRKAWRTRPSITEETKRKISESLRGREAPNKGIPHSEKTRQKMREAWEKRKRSQANE